MNIKKAREIITSFISGYIQDTGAEGVVLGLSGGLDSSVTAFLAVEALGRSSVDLVALPYKTSDPESINDSKMVAEILSIPLTAYDISSPVDEIIELRGEIDRLRIGNIAARVRMIFLYDISAERNRLVIGTGNRSERILGYTTLWGDMACAFTPLGGLLKTQERMLAREIGVPEKIITKTPSADLWSEQTDESEMGITYETADRIIYGIFDEGKEPEQLIEEGIDRAAVKLLMDRHRQNSFKFRMPPYPELNGLELL